MDIRKYELVMEEVQSWDIPKTVISTGEDVYKFATEILKIDKKDREVFSIISLSTKGEIIGCHDISVGTLDSAIVSPREVLKYAILDNAANIICLHNHPSGDPEPSDSDKTTTKRLKNACEIIGIGLHDHVIIGREARWYSLAYHRATCRQRRSRAKKV